jgi:branched-chain amino acid transport system substrate-binding protein
MEFEETRRRSKLWFLLVAAIVLLIISLVYFNSYTGFSTNEGNIKIGATVALSGNLAYIGQQELNGLILAAEEINVNGGVSGQMIEVIYEDNAGDPKEGVSAASKFVNLDNVDVVFSAFTHITSALKDVVYNSDSLLIYASTVPDIAEGSDYAFRDYIDNVDHGESLAFALDQEDHREIALITEISEACSQFEDSFIKSSERLGIDIVSRVDFQVADKDLRTAILKLNPKEVDAIVTCTWRHEDIFMKQFEELGFIEIPTFHLMAPFFPVAQTNEIRDLYSKNGAISTWYGFPEVANTKRQKDFIRKYEERFGFTPSPDAAYTYDDVYVLAQAVEKCKEGIKDKNCVASELLKTDYDGVGGHLKFDEIGSSVRETLLIKNVNGEWVSYN